MSIKHLQFDDSGTVDFSALTASYADILAMSDDADLLFIFNTTNAAIMLSVPSGLSGNTVQYKNVRFPASTSVAIDCRTNSRRIAKGTIQVKYASGAPTSGEVTVTATK